MAKAKRKSAKKSSSEAPWKHDAPKGSSHTHLTAKKKAAAKRSARKAGRAYPNLVDNMRAAAGSKRKKSARKGKTAKHAKTAKRAKRSKS